MVTNKTKPNVPLLVENAKQLSLAELFQLIQALLEIFQERFLKARVNHDEITVKLDQVYLNEPSTLDPTWVKLQQQAIGDEPW